MFRQFNYFLLESSDNPTEYGLCQTAILMDAKPPLQKSQHLWDGRDAIIALEEARAPKVAQVKFVIETTLQGLEDTG
jgi:hypothetical protein